MPEPFPADGPRISACVVNFQGIGCLEATLRALLDPGVGLGEILLVDSASTDGSPEMVEDRYPEVKVIRLAMNRGPAVARNVGYAKAVHDRVLFVDHDVVIQPGCVDQLSSALRDDRNATMALPRVLFGAHPHRIQFEGADAHFLGLMALRRGGEPNAQDVSGPREVGSMVTACFLMDREKWGREPPFDESFGFNYEDHEFGVRSRLLGHRILAVPAAVCLHGEGTPGLSVRGDGPYPAARAFHLLRGRWTILLKTYQLRTLFLLGPMLLVFELAQLLLAYRRGWVREWIRAAREIAARRGSLAKEREALQKNRRVTDRDLFSGGPLPIRPEVPKPGLEKGALDVLNGCADLYWRVVRHVL